MNYQQWHKPAYEHTAQISISVCDILEEEMLCGKANCFTQ